MIDRYDDIDRILCIRVRPALLSKLCCAVVRISAPIHYRGLLIQPRLADANGFLIGSLTGGRFIEDESWSDYAIRFQTCYGHHLSNDSITHSDERKKFLTQIRWTTDVDIGAVQFL